MGIMGFARLLAVGVIVVSAATGCATVAPTPPRPTPTAAGSGPTATHTTSWTLSGTFVPQGAPTRGQVRITEKPGSLVLTLSDFSTGPGQDLYIDFNPGAMTRNAAGDNVVEDPNTFQVVALKDITGTQSYDLSYLIPVWPQIRSVTIFSSKSREAFGTANLR
ncbi:DM13 domain-containing protein [Arthrobacter sp. SDTb3-6]|uniref:DM13 domain-containing protein n=1 Tax=Arthrobacter sp. SDTb3-6 TaxID=2713571 RepID=UPI0035266571